MQARFDDYEDQLIAAALDGDRESRRRAIQLLGQVGSSRTLAVFEELLRGEPDYVTAREVVRATVAIGGPHARRLLETAASHPSPLVRGLVETLGHGDRLDPR